jgi:hypothetical protein
MARLARRRTTRTVRATPPRRTPTATRGSSTGIVATAVRTRMGSAKGKRASVMTPPPTVHVDISSMISALEGAVDSSFMAFLSRF